MIDSLLDPTVNPYITSATRAHMIQFLMYNPSSDLFVAVDILIEFLVSGLVNPTYLKIVPFKANIFEVHMEKILQVCDIFRFLICILMGYWIFLKIVSLL